MDTTPPPSALPPVRPSTQIQPRKPARLLLYGCGGLLGLVLIIFATIAITLWWIQRPIKPVVLSAPEKAEVEAKLRRVGGGEPPERPLGTLPFPITPQEKDRSYTPGSKVFKLTERELNGLLNANTDLGNSVRLELGSDAINAYVAVPIPQDFPIGGGRMFRARARFKVSLGNGGAPYAILEDVTILGLSLPKAWLGGLKGENLLERAAGQRNGAPVLKGIKSLRVEPGALVLEVAD